MGKRWENMIKVSDISMKYGKQKIIEDISFEVQCGERVAIVGKNGCGKSTLMKILAGTLKPQKGSVSYFGQDALKNNKIIRQFCGYVPQENPLIDELSVRDNLKLWESVAGKKAQDVVSYFQLNEMMKKPVRELSGGMKRRLGIACALVGWPSILLLDEPTTALDLYYKESINTLLNDYQKMNGMVVLTTHDQAEIMACDRCLVITDGHLKELKKEEIQMDMIKKYIGIKEKKNDEQI